MAAVIGFGAINLDYIYAINKNINIEDKEEIINQKKFNKIKSYLDNNKEIKLKYIGGGGQAANTIVALSHLGQEVAFIGRVGNDKEGKMLLEELRNSGVDTKYIEQRSRSNKCLILTNRNKRDIYVLPGAKKEIDLKNLKIKIEDIEKYSIMYISSFCTKEALSAQINLIKKLPKQIKICFDAGGLYARCSYEQLRPILTNTDILFLTEKELLQIMQINNKKEAIKKLLSNNKKIEVIVCKEGRKGSTIFTKKEKIKITIKNKNKYKIVDTTGAGDAYAAGFIAAYIEGKDLYSCGEFATAVATLAISDYGRKAYKKLLSFREHLL